MQIQTHRSAVVMLALMCITLHFYSGVYNGSQTCDTSKRAIGSRWRKNGMNNPLRFWRKRIEPTVQSDNLTEHVCLPHRATFRVQGMHCASCVVRVERKLKQIEGVQQVEVNGATGKADLVCLCVPSVECLHQAV